MDKLFIITLLGLLILANGVAENMVSDNFAILEELESFEIDEENDIAFGAVGDGISDDTQAFVKAWDTACATPEAVFLVPSDRHYLVNATRFKGPCEDRLVIQIDGTIVAPDEPKNWDPDHDRQWLEFSKLNGVVFQGNGVIDGSGSKWWASSCKTNKTNPCRGAPSALTIDSSSSVNVKGLTIKNSQQMHFVISKSASVRVSQDCKIGTGDDCISIVNGSSGIKMKRIYCGPGHGVSIGSLGKDSSTGIVTKVVLDTAFIRETTNGVRIKTWQGGNGYVRGVRFENVRMENVDNPIIIDQFYCDSPKSCQNQTSAVKISEIMYRNISGTTNSEKAMRFACSDSVPCSNIILSNVNLEMEDSTVETYCNSAEGFGYGIVHPSADCLNSHDKDYSSFDQTELSQHYILNEETEIDELPDSYSDHIVHSEL
ncbi:hypothetical protein OIU85_002857 [Salix viminalis]|uniref:Pectate lyase superfamily protein domain-containing protein n=1 Tax=Salix viminalis TaxID=40686 RepID=A0A9Q0VRR4_SALVM|nr:hypothetical protein OIU85_002857 [Salix viminalis]